MVPIETDRLQIRNFRENDWKALLDIVEQYEASPYAAYDHEWPTSEDEIRKIAGWFSTGDEFLAVCLRETGTMIGFIALNRTRTEGELSLGYCFDFNYHRRGYAYESCRALIDHAFSVLGARRLVTGTGAENKPSCGLLTKLGFKRVDEQVCSFRKDKDGKPVEFLGVTFELVNPIL